MFDWLFNLLGTMLSFFNSITGSYALALLFYALVFKIVLLPFNIKQQKNQIKSAKLTPKIEVIKAKYKGRRDQHTMQKMQQEIMELQQKEGSSPMSGCLPLLIQLPIIMLLYTVIQNPMSHIARTSDIIDEYNSIRESITYGELVDKPEYDKFDKLLNNEHYSSVIRPSGTDAEANGKTPGYISKDDVILAVYNNYMDTPINALSDNSRAQIDLVSRLNEKVGSAESEAERESIINELRYLGINYDTVPNFDLFGIMNLGHYPDLGNPSPLLIIVLLVAVSSWFSMWISKKMNNTGLQGLQEQDDQARKSMQIMDLMMPLISVIISFNMPGMLGVYWIYQSVLGIIVSFIMAKAMPMPKYTEEDIKEIKRQKKEAERISREYAKTHKHRSRHYIDEDDYDELPELPENQSQDSTSSISPSDMPQIKD